LYFYQAAAAAGASYTSSSAREPGSSTLIDLTEDDDLDDACTFVAPRRKRQRHNLEDDDDVIFQDEERVERRVSRRYKCRLENESVALAQQLVMQEEKAKQMEENRAAGKRAKKEVARKKEQVRKSREREQERKALQQAAQVPIAPSITGTAARDAPNSAAGGSASSAAIFSSSPTTCKYWQAMKVSEVVKLFDVGRKTAEFDLIQDIFSKASKVSTHRLPRMASQKESKPHNSIDSSAPPHLPSPFLSERLCMEATQRP